MMISNELLKLLSADEIEQYNKAIEQYRQNEAVLIAYHKDNSSISEDKLEEVREQQMQIEEAIDSMQNIALSRLSADKDINFDFSDRLTEVIFESEKSNKSLSQQWAEEVAAYYCEQCPEKKDLYEHKANETLTEYVKRIAAALEVSEDISVSAKRAEKVDYPLDKVNSKIWNLLERTPERQIGIFAGSKSGKDAIVTYSINFDGLSDVRISRKLTQFDKRVYIAVSALYNAGNRTISLTQIAYAMGQKSKPSDDILKRIYDSIIKMKAAQIDIDNSAEVKVYKNYVKFVYHSSLLPIEIIEAKINGKLTDAAINIFREPPMVSYAKQHKQITTVSVKLLQSPLRNTELNLSLEDYLIEQISHIKSGYRDNRMLYSTIYKDTNITDKKQKQRAPDRINDLLEHYKRQNWIKDYRQDKLGIDIIV